MHKSAFCRISLFSLHQFQHFPHFFTNGAVILSSMGAQAGGAVLDSILGIPEAAAALIAQAVQGAIAKQAAEAFRVRTGMAGKILTFLFLKKIVICHIISPALIFLKIT